MIEKPHLGHRQVRKSRGHLPNRIEPITKIVPFEMQQEKEREGSPKVMIKMLF
jgi:hypothetical protein